MNSVRIGVTGAGGPAGMAVLQSLNGLRLQDRDIELIAFDSNEYAPGFLIADSFVMASRCDTSEYLKQIQSANLDALIPTIDEELEYIGNWDGHLKVILPDIPDIKTARDKLNYIYLGVDTPQTMCLPIVIKPRYGRGGKRMQAIEHQDKMLVQEKIEGPIILVQALTRKGNLLRAVVTQRLRNLGEIGGPATAAITIKDENLIEKVRSIVRQLNWSGAIGIEFIHNPTIGKDYLIDINPRMCGQSHVATLAGMNLAYGLVELSLGLPLSIPLSYKEGVRYTRLWQDRQI